MKYSEAEDNTTTIGESSSDFEGYGNNDTVSDDVSDYGDETNSSLDVLKVNQTLPEENEQGSPHEGVVICNDSVDTFSIIDDEGDTVPNVMCSQSQLMSLDELDWACNLKVSVDGNEEQKVKDLCRKSCQECVGFIWNSTEEIYEEYLSVDVEAFPENNFLDDNKKEGLGGSGTAHEGDDNESFVSINDPPEVDFLGEENPDDLDGLEYIPAANDTLSAGDGIVGEDIDSSVEILTEISEGEENSTQDTNDASRGSSSGKITFGGGMFRRQRSVFASSTEAEPTKHGPVWASGSNIARENSSGIIAKNRNVFSSSNLVEDSPLGIHRFIAEIETPDVTLKGCFFMVGRSISGIQFPAFMTFFFTS